MQGNDNAINATAVVFATYVLPQCSSKYLLSNVVSFLCRTRMHFVVPRCTTSWPDGRLVKQANRITLDDHTTIQDVCSCHFASMVHNLLLDFGDNHFCVCCQRRLPLATCSPAKQSKALVHFVSLVAYAQLCFGGLILTIAVSLAASMNVLIMRIYTSLLVPTIPLLVPPSCWHCWSRIEAALFVFTRQPTIHSFYARPVFSLPTYMPSQACIQIINIAPVNQNVIHVAWSSSWIVQDTLAHISFDQNGIPKVDAGPNNWQYCRVLLHNCCNVDTFQAHCCVNCFVLLSLSSKTSCRLVTSNGGCNRHVSCINHPSLCQPFAPTFCAIWYILCAMLLTQLSALPVCCVDTCIHCYLHCSDLVSIFVILQ